MDVMDQTAEVHGGARSAKTPSETVDRFLSELTDLSHRHGIAISDNPQTFVIEREDRASSYTLDDESRLRFS